MISLLKFYFILGFIFCEFSTIALERRHDPFVVITPQKTGTHLLMPIVRNMIGNEWCFVPGDTFNPRRFRNLLRKSENNNNIILNLHCEPKPHIINILKKNNYKVLFMWRDPRDQVLSMLFRVRWGRVYGPLNMSAEFGQLSFEEQLHEVITGERFGFSVTRDMMINRIPWLYQDQDFVYVSHFENLIGEEGGGNRELQLQEMRNIANHLNVKLSDKEIAKCSEGVYGDSGNFRTGQIGEWKIYFSKEHKKLFKNLYGDSLIQTGYEKDKHW